MFRTKLPDRNEPLPEEEMSEITGFLDRGAAKYFHGRKDILDKFAYRMEIAERSRGGTILLVQGPPGVGKTALLAKCWEEAKKKGWDVAQITPRDLWDPDRLRKTLAISPEIRVVEGEGEAGIEKIFVAKGKAEVTIDHHPRTPTDILKTGDTPLLLILDEAQHLGKDSRITGGYKDDVRDLLDQIHNGRLGRPVLLLAGGLGTTDRALNRLGISRSSLRSITDLGPLEEEEERTVIREWLREEGEAKGDMKDWVDAIAKETYRWPQHIIAYTVPAAAHLRENGGEMTKEGLLSVLEQGRANRWAYYAGRTEGPDDDHILLLVEMFRDTPVEEGFRKQDLVAELGEPEFEKAVSRGILYYSNPLYTLPIPSLYDCLTERVSRIQEAALRYERVKKQRQASRHLTGDVSQQQPESKDQSEAEGSQKEAGNHTPDSPSPEKEKGKELTIRKSEKGNPRQEPSPGRDPSNSDRDTDMGMER